MKKFVIALFAAAALNAAVPTTAWSAEIQWTFTAYDFFQGNDQNNYSEVHFFFMLSPPDANFDYMLDVYTQYVENGRTSFNANDYEDGWSYTDVVQVGSDPFIPWTFVFRHDDDEVLNDVSSVFAMVIGVAIPVDNKLHDHYLGLSMGSGADRIGTEIIAISFPFNHHFEFNDFTPIIPEPATGLLLLGGAATLLLRRRRASK